jgi:hypothetical protein
MTLSLRADGQRRLLRRVRVTRELYCTGSASVAGLSLGSPRILPCVDMDRTSIATLAPPDRSLSARIVREPPATQVARRLACRGMGHARAWRVPQARLRERTFDAATNDGLPHGRAQRLGRRPRVRTRAACPAQATMDESALGRDSGGSSDEDWPGTRLQDVRRARRHIRGNVKVVALRKHVRHCLG